jgi:hypothetical protein
LCEWQWCFYLSSDDFKEEIMCFILDLARAWYFVFILLNTHSKIILSFSFINISLSCTVKYLESWKIIINNYPVSSIVGCVSSYIVLVRISKHTSKSYF